MRITNVFAATSAAAIAPAKKGQGKGEAGEEKDESH
ncbi:hypothetical protein DSL72_007242 [Monilinia vaccinii-corymbosi]|uniref:Uncharacterized protein n=1 Tax=Monilinia vaccinii-corymbosi TaxID=61207 RepID=A0A8A3PL25_9HELO|nr:hypothetical protein DSL72_007242 [Monilinia vaccinii-corymbosi]